MRRFLLCLFLPALLAACGSTAEPKWAPDDEVAQAVYRHDGPTSLTLFTVISNRSNAGAHSGLMVNGSQRVLFDPAGTWYHQQIPERNDVHFGVNEQVLSFYMDFHTRETYRTVVQTVEVSPEVAELALRIVQNYGAVPKAQCSRSISDVLSQLPGFESISVSWFPKRTMNAFGELPGVRSETVYDDDADDNSSVLAGQGA
ncbi:hypothetical protein [Cochlodiniinecator piscidefendens]|uniref:hypothetical protein n=1 Tax=Cochlodiniinecator piscidefendens TaxID=2715756 RepID=UPI00140C9FBC|nr:hypothetical protein [Cochlodiniinecator piscidefendens]